MNSRREAMLWSITIVSAMLLGLAVVWVAIALAFSRPNLAPLLFAAAPYRQDDYSAEPADAPRLNPLDPGLVQEVVFEDGARGNPVLNFNNDPQGAKQPSQQPSLTVTSPVPTARPSATSLPTQTVTPVPTKTPPPVPTSTPLPTSVNTQVPAPTSTPKAAPKPANPPKPAKTPKPANTPKPPVAPKPPKPPKHHHHHPP